MPTGQFFVAFLSRSPDASFGPFVVVTSAITDHPTDWQVHGSSVVTIAGQVDPVANATLGSRVTPGGIRLLDRNLAKLRDVPAGTPIDVVAKLRLAKMDRVSPACDRRSLDGFG